MAFSLLEEVVAVNEATGASLAPYVGLAHVTFQGREAEATPLIEAATTELVRRGDGQGLRFIHWVTAVLDNGLGRYEEALAAAQQAGEDATPRGGAIGGLVELIEAAARSGKAELAVDALGRLSQATAASGTDWALGVEARSRALLTEGEAAEPLYREAIEGSAAPVSGWSSPAPTSLRRMAAPRAPRARRPRAATPRPQAVHGVRHGSVRRARPHRAQATGEHARKRTVETRDDLTPQEAQISRLAADGATNREIAAQLFISPSTVDYHLRKAFRKLGVRSRHQLEQRLL